MTYELKKALVSSVVIASMSLLAACTTSASGTQSSQAVATTSKTTESTIDWENLPTKEVTLTNEGLTITEAGTYVLKGTTAAGVTVNTTGNVRLVLAGVAISGQDTAAIYVEAADNAVLELQEGTENTVSDSKQHSDSNIEGAIHSKADLTITGTGRLTVEGNFEDGIVSSDDLVIDSGTIAVTATDDGIRGKDSVTITGGTIDVIAVDDGIKSNNDQDASKGIVHISGGTITVQAGDDGIKAESSLIIDDGQVTVTSSTEGLEGTNVTINGGIITVTATDDGINAASTAMGADIFIKVTGGTINVSVGQGDTDAFDSNGNLFISGGSINVTAPTSGFDFDGSVEFTGGDVTVNGEKKTEIIADGPGGGFGGGPRGGW
ncbi:carbohydrate-binding domain-containing protein [Streptococcus handemini]|uniref:carbohydrate-binding domain-containing protein n=1 Tax=Streptococcus handemini TaxID=3161188 RepID=UPI00386C8390